MLIGSFTMTFGLPMSQPFGVAFPTIHILGYAGAGTSSSDGVTEIVTALEVTVLSLMVTLAWTTAFISAALPTSNWSLLIRMSLSSAFVNSLLMSEKTFIVADFTSEVRTSLYSINTFLSVPHE